MSIIANNLRVKSANVEGTISANQIATNISQVNSILNVGNQSERGQIVLYGDGSSWGSSIKQNNMELDIWTHDDIFIGAGRKLEIQASDIGVWGTTVLDPSTYIGSKSDENMVVTKKWVQQNAVAKFG